MTHFKKIAFATALSLGAFYNLSVGQAHEIKIGNLVISHPWSRQPPAASDVAAGFFKVTNNGKDDDRLIKATVEITPKVQLHSMKMEGDVMKMEELPDGIAIPAGQTVELKPASLHVMFMDLKHPLMEGEEIKGTLVFEKAGTVDIDYEVVAPGDNMKMH